MDLNPSLISSSLTLSNPGLDRSESFVIEKQIMSNLCWAACTVGICRYYNGPVVNQKQLVAVIKNKPVCATSPPNPYCNDTADLGDALRYTHHLDISYNRPLTQDEMLSSLNAQRPVGCQIYLPRLGGGHVIIVYDAYKATDGSFMFRIADPADAALWNMPFKQILSNYRGSGGTWVRSYTTK